MQTFTWGERRSMMTRLEKEERERGYAGSSSESCLSPSVLRVLLQTEAEKQTGPAQVRARERPF